MKNPKQKQAERKFTEHGENLLLPSRKESLKVLAKAKRLEEEKLKDHEWVTSADRKTSKLVKIK